MLGSFDRVLEHYILMRETLQGLAVVVVDFVTLFVGKNVPVLKVPVHFVYLEQYGPSTEQRKNL